MKNKNKNEPISEFILFLWTLRESNPRPNNSTYQFSTCLVRLLISVTISQMNKTDLYLSHYVNRLDGILESPAPPSHL